MRDDDADRDLIERLRAMGLRLSTEALRTLLRDLHRDRATPTQTLERIFDAERRAREANNLARRTRLAMVGTPKPLDRFDWSFPRAIDRAMYESLHTMDFASRGDNVLLRGGAGTGKTTLAQHLALAALAQGLTVRFATLSTLLADLLRQESTPALERRLKRYTLPAVLAVDEVGYVPYEPRAADLFFTIICRRHEASRSTVVTTNLAFKQWPTVFPNATCLVPLVDRFHERCHVMDIEGDSWRGKGRRGPER
ncbi:MAG: ATP-binding protein [Polyangiales bacterium]